MARVRVHQHVNPLAKYYRELPIEPLNLGTIYASRDLPLHLDIGSGRGRFLLEMAKSKPDWNFLGTEIREPLVIEANQVRDGNKLSNLHYEFCNATIDLKTLLQDVDNQTLQLVTIQFPDPWFKKKHAKRRMVTENLVNVIGEKLARNARVVIQTDVKFLSEEMAELFVLGGFNKTDIEANPLERKTEREKSVEARDLPVYRAVFCLK